jgi:uncharacterized protein YbjT (DUF2867 family)
MNRSDLIIVVTGATGHQGGAAARHLLADGWHVRAFVRDPNKPAAKSLEKAGAELILGDLLDRDSLDRALDGAHGVHSVQTFREAGFDGEVREGFNVVDAAKDAGVANLVYSSVRGADRPSAVPFIESKRAIEARIGEAGIPATIWRPVTFMENLLGRASDIVSGKLTGFEPPDVVHQHIAVDDIGKFVALAFREHDRFAGVTKEIAGDEMSWRDLSSVFSLVLDLPIVYEQTPPPAGMPLPKPPEPDEPPAARADIESLRALVPDLWTLEQWIRAQEWPV